MLIVILGNNCITISIKQWGVFNIFLKIKKLKNSIFDVAEVVIIQKLIWLNLAIKNMKEEKENNYIYIYIYIYIYGYLPTYVYVNAMHNENVTMI